MRPSQAIADHREALLDIARRHGVSNVRIFGSVARGDDRDGSDVDLLVDAIPDVTTLFDIIRIRRDAETLLGVPVDIRTPEDIHESFRNRVLAEAQPL